MKIEVKKGEDGRFIVSLTNNNHSTEAVLLDKARVGAFIRGYVGCWMGEDS